MKSTPTPRFLFAKAVCAAAALAAFTAGMGVARAATVGLGVAGIQNVRIQLNVTEQTNTFTFSFINNSTIPTAITRIWFEQDLFSSAGIQATGRSTSKSGHVGMIDRSAVVATTPGLLSNVDWAGTQVAYLPYKQKPTWGINNGGLEKFNVIFDKGATPPSLSDVTDTLLQTVGSRVGLAIETLDATESVRFGLITALASTSGSGTGGGGIVPFTAAAGTLLAADPVSAPAPAALGAGLLGMGGLILRRRRRVG